ncbi:MAG: hypothetical protein ACK5HT_12585 [Draconibacterium sp.]
MQQIILQAKEVLSKTAVGVGAPTGAAMVGVMSFFEQMIPVLTVASLLTGIVIGILSYRLKAQKDRRERDARRND